MKTGGYSLNLSKLKNFDLNSLSSYYFKLQTLEYNVMQVQPVSNNFIITTGKIGTSLYRKLKLLLPMIIFTKI